MGRAVKGSLGAPEPGESKQRQIEISPGGLMSFGPYLAPDGMHVIVHSDGPVHATLACTDEAEAAVEAFVTSQPEHRIAALAQADITGSGELTIKPQRCKVAVAVRSLANRKVTFDFQRPPREIAQSTGGPAIHCAQDQEVFSKRHGSPGRAAARRR
jgi:hypothetical protein